MSDSAWAGVLMVGVAIVIAVAFITLWVRDKGRADEEATDPERGHTDTGFGAQLREGAAEEPPTPRREGRQ